MGFFKQQRYKTHQCRYNYIKEIIKRDGLGFGYYSTEKMLVVFFNKNTAEKWAHQIQKTSFKLGRLNIIWNIKDKIENKQQNIEEGK